MTEPGSRPAPRPCGSVVSLHLPSRCFGSIEKERVSQSVERRRRRLLGYVQESWYSRLSGFGAVGSRAENPECVLHPCVGGWARTTNKLLQPAYHGWD